MSSADNGLSPHHADLEIFQIPAEFGMGVIEEINRQIKDLSSVRFVSEVDPNDHDEVTHAIQHNLQRSEDCQRVVGTVLEAQARLRVQLNNAEAKYEMLLEGVMMRDRFRSYGIASQREKRAKARDILEKERQAELGRDVRPIEGVLVELRNLDRMWRYLDKSIASVGKLLHQADMVAKKLASLRQVRGGPPDDPTARSRRQEVALPSLSALREQAALAAAEGKSHQLNESETESE